MKHAYLLIFVVQLISAFPSVPTQSGEGSIESKEFYCNDIHDCHKIDPNMKCLIDEVSKNREFYTSLLKYLFLIFSTTKIIKELVIVRMVLLGTSTFVIKIHILNSKPGSQHSRKKL